jgi:antitoxin MazE
MMVTKVQKWGNSQGLRLTRQLLADAGIAVGDEVDVSAANGKIVISPARQVRGRYDINELVAQIPKGYVPEEVNWGAPVGQEEW